MIDGQSHFLSSKYQENWGENKMDEDVVGGGGGAFENLFPASRNIDNNDCFQEL